MPRRRTVVLGVAGVAVVGGAGLATAGLGGGGEGATAAPGTAPPATAPITRTTLVETQEVSGTIGYGGTASVTGAGSGTLTWLAAAGSVISRGRPAYRVDNRPVPLLYGRLPLYRTLSSGTTGPDVLQFERNLRALGYTGFTVDKTYNAATAAAVRRWQDDLGVEETGRVGPGSAVIAAGRIRVAERKASVGDRIGGPVFTYTRTARIVTIDLDVQYQRLARKGAEVEIVLVSGDRTKGRITAVGKVAKEGVEDKPDTIEVSIAVADGTSLGPYDRAPVDVRLTADRRENVLAVPIGALLARGDGGYAVQAVTDGRVRTIPVETGVFAGGQVEVSGAGLAEGMKVGVPE